MKNMHYVSLMDLTWSNFSLLQDKSEIFLLIILGNCLIVLSEWLEEKLMWSGVLLAVSKGKYFSLARLKITAKKSVSIEFISMAIESPSLHNAMISSLILSSFGSFAFIYCSQPMVSINQHYFYQYQYLIN